MCMSACVTVYVGVDWKFVLETATSTVGSENPKSWSSALVLQIALFHPRFLHGCWVFKPDLHACAVGIFLGDSSPAPE